jgi:hypothetical protein
MGYRGYSKTMGGKSLDWPESFSSECHVFLLKADLDLDILGPVFIFSFSQINSYEHKKGCGLHRMPCENDRCQRNGRGGKIIK